MHSTTHCLTYATFVAIVGPSASGKTSLAQRLSEKLGKGKTAIISQDQYYKDWSGLSMVKRKRINFDHPDSFDFRLLEKHLRDLKKGREVRMPIYSFKKHLRLTKHYSLYAKRYVIVEGLLVLHKRGLRNLFNLKIYVDVNKGISLSRRIKRDLQHRGENIETVCKRYFNDVLPMQERYVEPQKKWSQIIVDGNYANSRRLLNRLAKIV